MNAPLNEEKWLLTKLTQGSESGAYHSHAYYDIPVFDSGSNLLAGHKITIKERQPTSTDAIEIGYINLKEGQKWYKVGESTAWSWQQGAMSQWLPNTRTLIWNDRENGKFVSRLHSLDTGKTETMDQPIYAVDPNGKFVLSLNMARLDHVRPGYGYVGGEGHMINKLKPKDDGIWRIDLETGEKKLILSINKAAGFLFPHLRIKERLNQLLKSPIYWFNHVKVSPDGSRLTVKIRYRSKDLSKGWSDSMGASITCGTDGNDMRLLGHATSHVIWLDNEHLYAWQQNGLYVYKDSTDGVQKLPKIAPHLIKKNVHMRHFSGTKDKFIFDTPYQENIDLYTYDSKNDTSSKIATFHHHTPANGHFRCDLHPCPSPDGKHIVVTSLEDGGRQIYLLSKK
ncbi:TolB-like translocation protein [Anditalea andensis]|uniref:Uncharacterized protein n=1 Tax=Anditalea andensis TaxID=1048983 RepID=A0A074KUY4_9BACT|nr:hypothetical protein [Anditalea andensis]KEO72060.1 hypothetical protein EL17_19295 [Anditalea andensis]